jgi:hypothetical protein
MKEGCKMQCNIENDSKKEGANQLAAAAKEKNEVVIIIRDGKVIRFVQKHIVNAVEGMYGDGI